MPQVVELLLGGLGSEIGTLHDQLLDIEQHRFGAATSFVSTLTMPSGSGWSGVNGAPSVSAAINATGAAFILAGQGPPPGGGGGQQMGVSIDGVLPPVIKGEANFASSQCVWVQQGLSMGVHTFTVVEFLTATAGTVQNSLFIVVIPV